MLHHLPRRRGLAALSLAIAGLALTPAAFAGPGTPPTCAVPATAQLPACLPNLNLSMVGPPSLSGGELVTWTITLTHQGYPDLDDATEPDAPVRVSAIRVDVPEWSRFNLQPESVPADGLLRRGQSLTYRWSGRFGTEICRDKTSETVRAVVTVAGVRETSTTDNTAEATSRVVPCLTDLGVTKRADRAAYAPGETVTWTVGVVNSGSTGVRLSDIRVTDPLVSDLVPVEPPADGWLQPGATLNYRGTMVAGACGPMQNTATVSIAPTFGQTDGNPANDTVTATVPVELGTCAPPVPPAPPAIPTVPVAPVVPVASCPATRLAAAITAPRRSIAGSRLSVQITAANSGRATATGSVLRYRIPAGASLAIRPAGVTVRGGIATVRVGDLVPGARRTIRLTLGLDRSHGLRVHRLAASAECARSAAALSRTAVARQAQSRVPAVTG